MGDSPYLADQIKEGLNQVALAITRLTMARETYNKICAESRAVADPPWVCHTEGCHYERDSVTFKHCEKCRKFGTADG